jgi:hypothetical protein
MVEKTGIESGRIDFDLRDVAAGARDLPKIEERLPGEHPLNRFVYDEEWHNLMGTLKYLESAFREGAMTPEQEIRYRELKALLGESVPILKRLGFTLPPVPLDV